ncbi:MAG: DUF4837 family protein [Bacteroidales bacterium]
MAKVFSRNKLLFLIFVTIVVALASCRGDRTPLLPNVTGRAGEVVLVMNAPIWETEAGKSIGLVLNDEHPALPQAEPMFNVVRIAHAAFSNIFKTHRNIIVVNISDQFTDTRMNVRRNVWAKPQIVMEINAVDNDAFQKFVAGQGERIIEELLDAERVRIVEYNLQYENRNLRNQLIESLNVSIVFPPGYELNIDTTDFAWVGFSPPTQDVIQGVFVYQYDYTDKETFTPEYLIEKRNQFLRSYVQGDRPNSWMSTEMQASPQFSQFMDGSRYVARLAGLWRVENDFMGGPFISHTTLDEERNRVITVEGFVYAPGVKKRNLLRQVEAIISTLEIVE